MARSSRILPEQEGKCESATANFTREHASVVLKERNLADSKVLQLKVHSLGGDTDWISTSRALLTLFADFSLMALWREKLAQLPQFSIHLWQLRVERGPFKPRVVVDGGRSGNDFVGRYVRRHTGLRRHDHVIAEG